MSVSVIGIGTTEKEMVGGCCVCSDEHGYEENPLVYCDGEDCDVAVHQACYGIEVVPAGQWYCRKCEHGERGRAHRIKCDLCPSRNGALKITDLKTWAHVVCALYIPEIRFGDVSTMEPILVSLVPPERKNKVCYICAEASVVSSKSTAGACMQCNKPGCTQYFHVTCAQREGLLCDEVGNTKQSVKYCGYCQFHYSKLKKTPSIKIIPPFQLNHQQKDRDKVELQNSPNVCSTDQSSPSVREHSTRKLNVHGFSTLTPTWTESGIPHSTNTPNSEHCYSIGPEELGLQAAGWMAEDSRRQYLPNSLNDFSKSELKRYLKLTSSLFPNLKEESLSSSVVDEPKVQPHVTVTSISSSSGLQAQRASNTPMEKLIKRILNEPLPLPSTTVTDSTLALKVQESMTERTISASLENNSTASPKQLRQSMNFASASSETPLLQSVKQLSVSSGHDEIPNQVGSISSNDSSSLEGLKIVPMEEDKSLAQLQLLQPTKRRPGRPSLKRPLESGVEDKRSNLRRIQKTDGKLGRPLSVSRHVQMPGLSTSLSNNEHVVNLSAKKPGRGRGKNRNRETNETTSFETVWPKTSAVTYRNVGATHSAPSTSPSYMLGNRVNSSAKIGHQIRMGNQSVLTRELETGAGQSTYSSLDANTEVLSGLPVPRNSSASYLWNGNSKSSSRASQFASQPARAALTHPSVAFDHLLKNQSELGTQFLMEQAKHMDVAHLLLSLSQLKQENNVLEDQVSLLQKKRDLINLNARLSVPLGCSLSFPEQVRVGTGTASRASGSAHQIVDAGRDEEALEGTELHPQ